MRNYCAASVVRRLFNYIRSLAHDPVLLYTYYSAYMTPHVRHHTPIALTTIPTVHR